MPPRKMTAKKSYGGKAPGVDLNVSIKESKDMQGELMEGFYRHDQAVLFIFLPILTTLNISQHTQISSPPVLFVHLNCIQWRKVEFDIATDSKVKNYQCTCNKILCKLFNHSPYECLVIGITNNTDSNNGDPFTGYQDSHYIAGEVQEDCGYIPSNTQSLKQARSTY
ncbi:hypothetical protein EV424DRAFT_1347029 [Suillus variegatus]|nr:hypothetical protein EV424DRAFT_1347029 [Suillus variegatus]